MDWFESDRKFPSPIKFKLSYALKQISWLCLIYFRIYPIFYKERWDSDIMSICVLF